MHRPSLFALSLIALCSPALYAQTYPLPSTYELPSGAPGTATPQPFTQPVPRNLPSTAPNSPPLLNDGTGNPGQRLNPPRGNLAPPDGELPLLEQQLQRNRDAVPPGRRTAD